MLFPRLFLSFCFGIPSERLELWFAVFLSSFCYYCRTLIPTQHGPDAVQCRYHELTEAEAQPIANGGCNKRLRFISKLSKPWRMILLGITVSLLVVIVAYLCLILAYVAAVLWKANRLPDHSESQYSLYKNTRFEACTATPSPNFNCSIFTDDWTRPPNGSHYSLWRHGRAVIFGPPENWCEAASCFNGWKVVPSTPRHSAFSLTTLFDLGTALLHRPVHPLGALQDPVIS